MAPPLPHRRLAFLLALLALPVAPVHPLSAAQQQQRQQQKHAVVVGAGPVGIAAALSLASNNPKNKHGGFAKVTLLESSPPSVAQAKYDPTKAFLYNVNLRGQKFTSQFPNLQRKLEERGVASMGMSGTSLTIVPADPDEEIPMGKARVEAGGSSSSEDDAATKGGGSSTSSSSSLQSEKAVGKGYWVPRHEMVKLMSECVDEHNNAVDDEGGGCKIEFLMGRECVSVEPTKEMGDDDTVICLTARNVEDGSLKLHRATLIVGADGMNSKVRECLASAPSNTWWHSGGGGGGFFDTKKFVPKKWTSPASHLRIKVLQFPPRFEIPNSPGKPPLRTRGEDIYAIRSVHRGPRSYLSLGLLPMKDDTAVRPTNIVTRPDHEVWTIRDGPAMRLHFQRAFPRLNFAEESEGGMISDAEWDRFARAEGTRFPYCTYSEGLAVSGDEDGKCGVALVGDAAHAFPPDIGQGVNAGLMDVVCLDRALSGKDVETGEEIVPAVGEEEEEPSLGERLGRYQTQHAPETAALIRLARFGAPYQYRQPHRADRVLHKLWTLNVVTRLLLGKLTFGLVQPACIMLSQNNNLTFRQVMRRADLTTVFLRTVLVGGLGLLARRRFGFVGLFAGTPLA